MDELVAAARKDYQELMASAHKEPKNITSGDLKNIHEDDDVQSPDDIRSERRMRRARTGWTLSEIEQRAKELRERYKHLEGSEPPSLASGDMEALLNGKDDEATDE